MRDVMSMTEDERAEARRRRDAVDWTLTGEDLEAAIEYEWEDNWYNRGGQETAGFGGAA